MAHNELNREEGLEGRLLLWAADWLTVLLLAVGMLFPYLSACGISGQQGFDLGAVLAVCVFGSLGATAIFTWRHRYWAVLALAAAGGLIFWRLWINMAEDWNRIRAPELTDLFDASPGAMFLLYALAVLILGWIAVRVRAWWLAAAALILPVLPAIQAGTLPAWGAMLAGFAGWGSMLLTDLFSRKDPGSLARARFLSLGGLTALLLALVMCLPMEGYARPQWATDARRNLIQSVSRRLERFFSAEELENNFLAQLGLDLTLESEGNRTGVRPGEGPNAIESVGSGSGQREDLLNLGPRRYSGRRVMSVHTNQPASAGRIYLRGVSFDSYTGTSWENSFQSEAHPGLYPALTAPDAPEYTMTIRNIAFRGIWYYPYRFTGGGSMAESGQITRLDGDLADDPYLIPLEEMVSLGVENYQITYRPGGPEEGFAPLPGIWAEEEAAYQKEYYLSLPPGLAAVLEPAMADLRREAAAVDGWLSQMPEQFQTPLAAAARTAGFLASAAVYDPDAPAMEPDEDFAVRFLEEGRGYCVHFATAGALLLRMQGIPARYVNGYVAELDARGRGAVLDSDAHAWVEIYIDGYGWYPVEMTPGYSGGVSGVELESGGETLAPEEEPAEEEPGDAPEEEASGEEAPEDASLDGSASGEALPEEEDGPEEKKVSAIWKWLFVLAALWALLCAAYLLALLVRKHARADKDANRSVLNAYSRYKRLRRWGCGEDDELERLAKKAKFSQHTLTEEERESAWKCLDEDIRQSRIGQPVRRRWLFALLVPIF